jgi:hypothetical protein
MEWVGLVEFKNLYTLVLIQRLGGGYMVSGITHYADPPACYEATIPPQKWRRYVCARGRIVEVARLTNRHKNKEYKIRV